MRRYEAENNDVTFDPDGDFVRYDDAIEAIQDERDKLERIRRVAQTAWDYWPHDTFFQAIKTVLEICNDGTAPPLGQTEVRDE